MEVQVFFAALSKRLPAEAAFFIAHASLKRGAACTMMTSK
jgi:hypothetical protein